MDFHAVDLDVQYFLQMYTVLALWELCCCTWKLILTSLWTVMMVTEELYLLQLFKCALVPFRHKPECNQRVAKDKFFVTSITNQELVIELTYRTRWIIGGEYILVKWQFGALPPVENVPKLILYPWLNMMTSLIWCLPCTMALPCYYSDASSLFLSKSPNTIPANIPSCTVSWIE